MAEEEVAFQLMQLYRVLRAAPDLAARDKAKAEIDALLHELRIDISNAVIVPDINGLLANRVAAAPGVALGAKRTRSTDPQPDAHRGVIGMAGARHGQIERWVNPAHYPVWPLKLGALLREKKTASTPKG